MHDIGGDARAVRGEDLVGPAAGRELGGEARGAPGEGLPGTAVARDVIVLEPSYAHEDVAREASGAFEGGAGAAPLARAELEL